MKPTLLAAYLLLVLAPLVAVGWLGTALARQEQALVAVRFRDVLAGRLSEVNLRIMGLLEDRERELMAGPKLHTLPAEALRERARTSGVVRQYFVLDPGGSLVYPPAGGPRTEAEERFLQRTAAVWRDREIPGPDGEAGVAGPAAQGWHAGYVDSRIRLLFWWREDGFVVGAELNEVRLVSDIVGLLPEAWPGMPAAASPLPDGRIELVDAQGAVVYQWGGHAPAEGQDSAVRQALSPPLHAWSLYYFAPDAAVGAGYSRGVLFNVVAGIAGLALALVGLAVYFYRENNRVVREARQRVTFVNQVSHELRTPLTNIRMYAEMLDEDMAGADPRVRKRLDVIVSESQRLSRLIGNVLTFSRGQRATLTVHRTQGCLNDTVASVAGQFEGLLQARGLRLVLKTGAAAPALFDRDAVEQILGNLLSNAEKYAVGGHAVCITVRHDGDTAEILVADDGPGVPPNQRERIFDAFHRADHRITEGVSGVGLGLTIARQLARLHGGDLTVNGAERGVCFRVALHAPLCERGETV